MRSTKVTAFLARALAIVTILTIAVAEVMAQNQTSALETNGFVFFDAQTPLDAFRLQGVELTRLPDGGVKIVNGLDDRWPGVHLTGEWDMTKYSALLLEVESTSQEPITLYCRMDCADSDVSTMDGIVTREITLAPGQKTTWRVAFPAYLNPDTRKKLFAMRGKPGGITTDAYSNDSKVFFDKGRLTAIRPFENQNGRADSWILRKIVAQPLSDEEIARRDYLNWEPDKFFPMIDQFGQFIHDDWPGKTHSLEELRAQIQEEEKDLNAHQPKEFNQYGGWANGPQLEATGAFRTEKYKGVWFLVDPEGKLFWSHGVDCVSYWSATTPVTDREFYFVKEIPTKRDENNPQSQFLSESNNSVNNYYAGRGAFLQYNFTASNLYLKYGEDWKQQTIVTAAKRLRSWGFNTIGNWSENEVIRGARTPYVATVGIHSKTIQGSEGYWGKFVDPFEEEFPGAVERAIANQRYAAEDPYCIGFFVDNEISWGAVGSLARAALASEESQGVKRAFITWLQERYESFEQLKKAWGLEESSWEELALARIDVPRNEQSDKDCNAFYTVICDQYFKTIRDAMRKVAPGRLYLGCRFAWTNDLARASAQRYCDVVSYNFYKREIGSFEPVEGDDKPVMIGEFHFGALDRGLFHTGLGPCANQDARAKAYEDYVVSGLKNKWIVGTHWFQYGDQATTGRFDGENYQIGLVDVCDRPYVETIQATRKVGYNLYQIREELWQEQK
ncbi:MAG: beta-galactosidase [Planctomycetia bacterium]|nr:beta-galactosidase [Planctomycetia bacterium]